MHGIPEARALCRTLQLLGAIFACAALSATLAMPIAAQKDKKKKKDAAATSDGQPVIPMSDEQQIDYMISGMLGAWQLADVERLHQYYADDVMIVSGTWAPPVIGWANYSVLFQQQRARVQQVRMDRLNTYIKVLGNFGWACYQWDFGGTVDGQAMSSEGQTTLVVEKKNNRWLITHNHTSVAQAPMPAPPNNPNSPANTPPAALPQSAKPPSKR
jgi:ketosteroid isomerase-like protein